MVTRYKWRVRWGGADTEALDGCEWVIAETAEDAVSQVFIPGLRELLFCWADERVTCYFGTIGARREKVMVLAGRRDVCEA
jgi:hypothetical protein